jgi:iron complex outermembrane receptor protein
MSASKKALCVHIAQKMRITGEVQMSANARAVLLASVSLSVMTPVQAQDTTPGGSPTATATATGQGRIADIVVTARRRNESLLETPVAVTAFDAAELDRRQITQVSDIVNSTPSLVYEGTGGNRSEARIFIRGVGTTNANMSYGAGVGIYIDGAIFPRAQGALIDNLDIASLEVLRGPQGTLFGKNTIGGAINITTTKPNTDAVSGTFEAGYGRFDRQRVRASLNVPLSDTIAIRLAGMRDRDDGYTVNDVDGRRMDNQDRWMVSGAVRWTPTENLTWDLNAFWASTRDNGRALQCININGDDSIIPGIAAACARTNANGIRHTRSDIRQKGFVDTFATSSTLAWNLGKAGFIDDLTIKGIGAYQWIDQTGLTQDFDGTDLNGIVSLQPDKKMAAASGELQILGKAFDQRLNFVFGAYVDREWTPGGRETRAAIIYPHREILTGTKSSYVAFMSLKNKSRAAYTQVTYDFNDVISLTGGLRYTKDRRGFFRQRHPVSAFDPTFAQAGPFVVNGLFVKDFSNWSPMGSLQLNAPESWINGGFLDKGMLYFTYSKGFKSGGFNGNGSTSNGSLTQFNPEKVDNYEIGAKFSMFDRRLTGSVIGYQMDYQDIQLSSTSLDANGVPVRGAFNAGGAKIKGIEIELQVMLSGSLRLGLNADVTDAKYTRFDDLSALGGTRKNEPLAFIPDYRVSASIDNRFSLGGDMAVTPRVQVTRTGKRYLFSDPSPVLRAFSLQRAFTLVDASVRLDINDSLSLDIYGKNILNKAYMDEAQPNGYSVWQYYAPPVTYGVIARVKF